MATYKALIEGLQILAKYEGEDKHIGGAEHDILCAARSSVEVSAEDAERLDALGWHKDSEMDSWARFV